MKKKTGFLRCFDRCHQHGKKVGFEREDIEQMALDMKTSPLLAQNTAFLGVLMEKLGANLKQIIPYFRKQWKGKEITSIHCPKSTLKIQTITMFWLHARKERIFLFLVIPTDKHYLHLYIPSPNSNLSGVSFLFPRSSRPRICSARYNKLSGKIEIYFLFLSCLKLSSVAVQDLF